MHAAHCMQTSFAGALQCLAEEVHKVAEQPAASAASGLCRIEVAFPAAFSSLHWLMSQPAYSAGGAQPAAGDTGGGVPPAVYFSPRRAVGGAGDQTSADTCAGVCSSQCTVLSCVAALLFSS